MKKNNTYANGELRMKFTLAVAGILSCGFLLSGCATITRGSDDVLQVNTDPAGA